MYRITLHDGTTRDIDADDWTWEGDGFAEFIKAEKAVAWVKVDAIVSVEAQQRPARTAWRNGERVEVAR